MVDFLRKLTNISLNTKETINTFKESMKILFQMKWKSETEKEKTKLDFYFSLKKNFGFENYLDNISHSARTAITKLRLSCHCLPIEVLRYNGTEREDRTCNICLSNRIGDENHYLIECQNQGMVGVRQKFLTDIRKLCPQMATFSTVNIMTYCISMKDEKVQEITANFVDNLFKCFKMENNLPPLHILCLRYMGKIRKPCRTSFNMSYRWSVCCTAVYLLPSEISWETVLLYIVEKETFLSKSTFCQYVRNVIFMYIIG